jgi:hypothetical protein
VIDDQNIDRRFCRFQLEAQLLFEGSEDLERASDPGVLSADCALSGLKNTAQK